jgi:hypothetical protein
VATFGFYHVIYIEWRNPWGNSDSVVFGRYGEICEVSVQLACTLSAFYHLGSFVPHLLMCWLSTARSSCGPVHPVHQF